jgi:hypothetical protein
MRTRSLHDSLQIAALHENGMVLRLPKSTVGRLAHTPKVSVSENLNTPAEE